MKSKSWNRFLVAFMIVFALLLGACRSSEPEEKAPAEEIARPGNARLWQAFSMHWITGRGRMLDQIQPSGRAM